MTKPAVLPGDAATAEEWVDLVRADQLHRWPRGERVLVEDYLAACGKFVGDAAAVLDIVYQEVVLRDELGDRPDVAEYVERFPHLAARIRRQFSIHVALRDDEKLVEITLPQPLPTPKAKPPALPAPARPTRFPRLPGFEVLGEVGPGGFGVVYKARQLGQDRIVALRLVQGSGPGVKPALNGPELTRLRHPNVVQVYEVGQHEGTAYVASEFIAGNTLAEKIRGRPVPPQQAAKLVGRIAWGVAAAHAAGAIHGDLRPSHILLQSAIGPADGPRSDASGNCQLHYSYYVPKVADFGLARRGSALLAEASPAMGVAAYCAPEQARDESPTVAADIHALGAILYEALTGRAPFLGPTAGDALQALQQDPVPPGRLVSGLPTDLERVCDRCLAKDPAQRYPTAQALADDIDAFLAGRPIASPKRPLGTVVADVRQRWKTAVASAVALASIAVFALLWRQAERRADEATEARVAADKMLYSLAVGQAHEAVEHRELDRAKTLLERCPEGLRGWDWHWIQGRATGQPSDPATVGDVSGATSLAAILGDRASLAVGTTDNALVVLDVAKGRVDFRINVGQPIAALATAPDGTTLAVTLRDGDARLWNYVGSSWSTVQTPPKKALAVAWRSADDLVVLPADGDASAICTWPARRGGPPTATATARLQYPAVALATAPDGRWVATAGGSNQQHANELAVWDAGTLNLRYSSRRLQRSAWTALAAHGDGLRLAVGNANGEVILWDVATATELFALKAGDAPIAAIAFADNGRRLYAAVEQGPLRYWAIP